MPIAVERDHDAGRADAAMQSRVPRAGRSGPRPDMPESTKSEDLFVFTVKHVTLKKGERLVAAVAEFSRFRTPTSSRWICRSRRRRRSGRQPQHRAAGRDGPAARAPKVTHKVRLTNKSSYPLTTAPALVVRDDRVLAQGMMTYTAVNASSDLEVTKAVDIQVAKSDAETARVPNAARWQGNQYARVDLAGTIKLTNYRDKAVDIEVTRHVLGNVTGADNGGVVAKVNVFEEAVPWRAIRRAGGAGTTGRTGGRTSTASAASPGRSGSSPGRAPTSGTRGTTSGGEPDGLGLLLRSH